jgi:hypothetical protein
MTRYWTLPAYLRHEVISHISGKMEMIASKIRVKAICSESVLGVVAIPFWDVRCHFFFFFLNLFIYIPHSHKGAKPQLRGIVQAMTQVTKRNQDTVVCATVLQNETGKLPAESIKGMTSSPQPEPK